MKNIFNNMTDNRKQVLFRISIVVVAFFVLKGVFSSSGDSLPGEVHRLIDRQYVNCVDVKGTEYREGANPESECTRVETEVIGDGIVPAQEQSRGVTEAICYRVRYENPYFWAPSNTQYEEITFSYRIASKVAVQENGDWITFPDQERDDRERWDLYSCPAEYDVAE
ncbi:MAG TPA: hypothetical protein VLA72_09060 [Anaerolineales bacterium]|nr:hypothetical protein [Anaerolineales bacterium]